jgi:hypothetical protein
MGSNNGDRGASHAEGRRDIGSRVCHVVTPVTRDYGPSAAASETSDGHAKGLSHSEGERLNVNHDDVRESNL